MAYPIILLFLERRNMKISSNLDNWAPEDYRDYVSLIQWTSENFLINYSVFTYLDPGSTVKQAQMYWLLYSYIP